MTKKFRRGLVVGKFSPLHRGHELVIRRALEECAEVVLITYSKPELHGCDAERRELWLATLFPQATRLVVTDERLHAMGKGVQIPDNDADAITHRRFCGFLCQDVLGVTVAAVFTSEEYGEGFARELTNYFRATQPATPPVQHIMIDRSRAAVPVSGTELRQDIHRLRNWLSPEVYASFIQRVCLLGGESSGKSTLAEALAAKFGTTYVAEFGRELWEAQSGVLAFDDMLAIGRAQVEREELAVRQATRFLFCDTSPLTTLFYSIHLFGKADPELQKLADRPYDLTILCAPDFAFVQDGTRQREAFRLMQHEWYLAELSKRGIPFFFAIGPLERRIAETVQFLQNVAEPRHAP